VSLLALILLPEPGRAQETAAGKAAPTRRVVAAGRNYEAGSFHRFLLGNGYRDLWRTSIEVEVLDLGSFAGGLTPTKKGGGKQTRSLTFEDAEGREWKFRSIDKDPSAVLPEDLRDTFVDTLVQDQISAAHPLGPMLVDPLAEAAGVLTAHHRLVFLADDPRLGEFRREFSDTLGFIEEKIRARRPVTPGFEDFHPLLDTVELWERLDDHPEEKVDARALLNARLFDVFINDFDRHKDQWRWARRRGSQLWEPVPEDRDQAFVHYSGAVMALVRRVQPRLVDFGPQYPRIFGLTWQGRFIDRRHLAELDWAQWQETIAALQSRLTDAVIEAAVAQLPEEYRQITGDRTGKALKRRRDQLPQAARRFYEQLAEDVEIHASDHDEVATIEPAGAGSVRVRLSSKEGETRFERRFEKRDTRSIRLYLKGGDDRVVRQGDTGGITLRVVGGKGADELDDSRAGGTHFYDEGGKSRVIRGPGTAVNNRPYTHPLEAGNPARDWGEDTLFTPVLSGGGDLGVFLGGRIGVTTYGFRHHPYARFQAFTAGFATGLSGFRAEYNGTFLRENREARVRLDALATDVDLIRYYGLGNETPADAPEDFYLVQQRQFRVSPRYEFGSGALRLSLGLLAQYTTEPPRASLAQAERPYGFGGFGKVGPRVDVALGPQKRGAEGASASLKLGGSFFPKVWSVSRTFGEIHGESGLRLASGRLPLRPALLLRAGGKKVFGRYPFQEAAFLGGSDTLRGLRPQRYAGDASIHGSAELRLRLARVKLLVPAEIGVLGLADAGRVFLAGEDSRRWHHAVGGGLWLAVLRPENTVSLAMARSEGVTRLYLRAGFGF